MADTVTQHDHRGVRAIQRMVEYAPSTGGLALWVRHENLRHPDLPGRAPAVMTDGTTVFYGEAFASLPLPEQTGLVAHEVLHVALRHPQRALDLQRLTGDVDRELFNICADAIVNSALSHLGWLRLPAAVGLSRGCAGTGAGSEAGRRTALLDWDVERLYRAIDDRRPARRDRAAAGQRERPVRRRGRPRRIEAARHHASRQ